VSDLFRILLWVVLGYLTGSIPFGYLLVRMFRGVDIRTAGSGNIGATNVYRIAGGRLATAVFLCDTAKGWLPVATAGFVGLPSYACLLSGLSAILGHSFSCFLRGKGGKGVATSFGVAIALIPYAALCALGVWVAVTAATRYVSAGSIAAACSFPFFVLLFHHGDLLRFSFAAAAALFIVVMHRSNVARLVAGTEHRIHLPWMAQPQ